jgi:exodeoxyribonuclease VII large subunit
VSISEEPKSEYLTVTELTVYLKRLIQSDNILRTATVVGEVTGFTRYKSGHIYFSLKDDNSLLKCVFFKNYHRESYDFLEDGARILVKGYIGVFEKRGEYQLYVSELSDFGKGNILLQLEKLKKELDKKGYFDPKHKKDIPKFPEKIGIVAAKESAGFQDILRVFRERAYYLDIIVADCRVQGKGASKEISLLYNKSSI